jgi:hypothetical protein
MGDASEQVILSFVDEEVQAEVVVVKKEEVTKEVKEEKPKKVVKKVSKK